MKRSEVTGVHGGQQRGHDAFPVLLTRHPFSQFRLCVCVCVMMYSYLCEDQSLSTFENENIQSVSNFFTGLFEGLNLVLEFWFWVKVPRKSQDCYGKM